MCIVYELQVNVIKSQIENMIAHACAIKIGQPATGCLGPKGAIDANRTLVALSSLHFHCFSALSLS